MKGQATAFIILGIIILTVIATVYTFREQILSATLGIGTQQTITVPPEAERVKVYVDTCLQETTQQGIDILSAQGGYITIPPDQQQTLISPFAANLNLFKQAGTQVPFWYTLTPNNIEKNQVPTKQDIENDLAAYIDAHLAECLNNFKALQNQGYSINQQKSQTKVALNDNTVGITTQLPLHIVLRDFTFDFTTFKKTINSDLGNLYALALQIMDKENKEYFLENRALDMMTIYDTIPYSGVDFECTPKTWLKTKVQKELGRIFAANFPSIRIKGSQYKENVKDHKSFVIDALSQKTDAFITFSYNEQWPLLMEVVGENDEVLRGKPFTAENEASRFLLPLFCLNDYHFVYNVQFPVLVTLQQGDSSFEFATLSIIDHNQPRENRIEIPSIDIQADICDNPGKQLTVVAATYLPDNTLQEIPNARISYKCLDQVCDRGRTSADRHGAALTTTFPQCSEGTMIAEKDGYSRGELPLSTNTAEGEIVVYLEPIKEVAADVKVIDNQQERSPYATEQILFTLENQEKQYTTSFIYPDQKTVKIIPGTYIVTSRIVVSNAGSFNFPEKEVEICNDVPEKGILGVAGVTQRQCTKQKIDATKLDQIIGGGSVTTWTVPRASLATAQKVTFYTIRGQTPKSIDELSKVYEAVQRQGSEVKKPILE